MKFNIKIVLLVAVAIAFGVFVGYFTMRPERVAEASGKSLSSVKVTKTKTGPKVKKITEISLERRGRR